MTLLYLRRMIAFEETDDDDLPTGRLRIFAAIPKQWWKSKSKWSVKGLPTAYGKLDLSYSRGAVECRITGNGSNGLKEITFPIPEGAKIDLSVGQKRRVGQMLFVKPRNGRCGWKIRLS